MKKRIRIDPQSPHDHVLQGLQQLAYQLLERGLRETPHARLLALLTGSIRGWTGRTAYVGYCAAPVAPAAAAWGGRVVP